MTRSLPARLIMFAAVAFSAFLFFKKNENGRQRMPQPTDRTEVNLRHKEGDNPGGYGRYYEMTRRLALGPDWREITRKNREEWEARIQQGGAAERTSYAGGLLVGDWYERGCSNITGSISAFDLYEDEWYCLGTNGTVWKGNLGGTSWSLLSQQTAFQNRCMEVINNSGTKRIITTYNGDIRYSDNNGATWTDVFIATYSDGRQLIQLPNGDLYYLATTGSQAGLLRSTNGGGSWTVIKSWTTSSGTDRSNLWQRPQTNELWCIDGENKLWTVSGATLTLLNTGTGMTTGTRRYLTAYTSGGTTTFYVTHNSTAFYRSTDNGLTWTLQNSLDSDDPWSLTVMANPSNGHVYYGGVEFWKSTNEGTTFTKQNNWWDYYNDINDFHADMMCFRACRTGGGTDFFAVSCHGGLYVSYDNFATTDNITEDGLRYSDLYDVVTISNKIMAGTQDQGWHRFSGASGTGILTATQPISGDYVRMNHSQNATRLWCQYPNGDFAYYSNPNSNSVTDWYTIGGTANTNFQQWAVPTCNSGTASENAIFVGGGTLAGGGDASSYLLKLTGGNPVTATQYAYDFRANNSGTGWIAAVENSPVDPSYLFVASSTGKFFYSWDGGSNWVKHATLTGPSAGWLYGSFIWASRLNRDKLWYCGAGGKVYQSVNGGATFTSIASTGNGMPNTFITELCTNATETVLFAATEAGPYAYLFQTNTWYALADASTPLVDFSSVEYIAADNVMRFSTHGRGIWDFKITTAPLPVEVTAFNGKLDKNNDAQLWWNTASEANADRFDIERSADGLHFEKIGSKPAQNRPSDYRFTDFLPKTGVNYYRLQQVDRDGRSQLSSVVAVEAPGGGAIAISPNPAPAGGHVFVENFEEGQSLRLFDRSGKLVFDQKIGGDGRARLNGAAAGGYFFEVKNEDGRRAGSGSLFLK